MAKKPLTSEVRTKTGNAGELHQQAGTTILTTQQGVPIADDQNSLRAGARGPR